MTEENKTTLFKEIEGFVNISKVKSKESPDCVTNDYILNLLEKYNLLPSNDISEENLSKRWSSARNDLALSDGYEKFLKANKNIPTRWGYVFLVFLSGWIEIPKLFPDFCSNFNGGTYLMYNWASPSAPPIPTTGATDIGIIFWSLYTLTFLVIAYAVSEVMYSSGYKKNYALYQQTSGNRSESVKLPGFWGNFFKKPTWWLLLCFTMAFLIPIEIRFTSYGNGWVNLIGFILIPTLFGFSLYFKDKYENDKSKLMG